MQSYKTHIKILLAYSGFEQPGPGAPLLGLAKSKYYNVYNWLNGGVNLYMCFVT